MNILWKPAQRSQSIRHVFISVIAGAVALSTAVSGVASAESMIDSAPPGSLLGAPSLSIAGLSYVDGSLDYGRMFGSLGPGSVSGSTGLGIGVPRQPAPDPAVKTVEMVSRTNAADHPAYVAATSSSGISGGAPMSATVGSTSSAGGSASSESGSSSSGTAPVRKNSNVELWRVNSPAMGRAIDLEVYPAPGGGSSPFLYYLDGVGSVTPSGWYGRLGGNGPARTWPNATVVVPVGAPSSLWADWVQDDPRLGRHRWETFLTSELPGLLKMMVPNNGKFGVLGVSMGASSALHLANAHPDMFSAAGGVSGCYSTVDEDGSRYVRLTVEAHGGDVNRMWGPPGSPKWHAHDTVASPQGLRGQRVYLSAATGEVGLVDLASYGVNSQIVFSGHILESESMECTEELAAALDIEQIDYRVDYDPAGVHNWSTFTPRVRNAVEYMLVGMA